MQTRRIAKITWGILCLSLLSACMEKDLYQVQEYKPADAYFGFTTSTSCAVDLNYGFENYQVVFELYAENPLSEAEDGSVIKTKEEPLYRGSTDKDGKFVSDINIPSYVTELYLYSDYLKTISPIKLVIANGKVAFDQKAFIAKQKQSSAQTRAIATNGYAYPDGYKILGNWNKNGIPAYLSSSTTEIDPQLLYNIYEVLVKPGGQAAMEKFFPEYIADDVNIEINIKEKTKISLVMLNSTASKQGTVGYFTYPTGNKPKDVSSVTPIIAYPRISNAVCNSSTAAGMYMGDRVDLKYWDGTKFVDEFPAGVSIAWLLMESSFRKESGDIILSKGNQIFYSIRDLNRSKEHRTIALKNKSGQVVAFGMEDAVNFTPSLDNTRQGNFGDAVFYLDFSKGGSIETGGVEDLPDTPLDEKSFYTSSQGVLSFEDSWPKTFDYDMNDLVVEYERKVHKNLLTSKVVKIEDTFVPRHDGATYQNGFGYQFTGIPIGDVKSVKIESDGIVSKFMEGNMLETGQDYPTIILFDNQRLVMNKTFKVTIEIVPEKYSEQAFTPFFENKYWDQKYKFNMNPFIIISSDEGRSKEAHIVKFPPTNKMDRSLFRTGFDASSPDEGTYYVNNYNLPTGLQINGVKVGVNKSKDFLIPRESVSILKAYPQFKDWASSFGEKNSIWWKNPDESLVIK